MAAFIADHAQGCVIDYTSPHLMDSVLASFWAEIKSDRLKALAQMILSASSSTASSERLFSVARLIRGHLRSRMDANTLEQCLVTYLGLRNLDTDDARDQFVAFLQREIEESADGPT